MNLNLRVKLDFRQYFYNHDHLPEYYRTHEQLGAILEIIFVSGFRLAQNEISSFVLTMLFSHFSNHSTVLHRLVDIHKESTEATWF